MFVRPPNDKPISERLLSTPHECELSYKMQTAQEITALLVNITNHIVGAVKHSSARVETARKNEYSIKIGQEVDAEETTRVYATEGAPPASPTEILLKLREIMTKMLKDD